MSTPTRSARDLAHLTAAIEGQPVAGAFMNAPSPGIVALFAPNEHYGTLDEYLDAIGEAMKVEYEAIVAAGVMLQIDAPDLAMGRHIMYRDRSDEEFVASVERHVEAINTALRDIPADRVRMHLCWGNYEGPHHLDIDVEKIAGAILRAKPATTPLRGGQPAPRARARRWARAAIPEDKVLVPGVIDTTTNYIEHPELVAQRIEHFTAIVGPERVMAGTDCGFGTWSGYGAVDPDICWAKLRSLADGARIAAERERGALIAADRQPALR